MTTITLTATGVEPLTFTRADGWIVKRFDWEPGQPRTVVREAPLTDGVIDTSRLFGAGALTVAIRMTGPGVEARLRHLRAFTRGNLRPRLTVDYDDGSPPVFAVLSQGFVSGAIEQATHRDVVAQWSVPFGIMESATLNTEIARASASDDSVIGRSYPKTYPWSYPAAPISGSATVVNAGTATAYPVLRLRGPMSDRIEVTHVEQDRSIVIDGTTIPAGSYIEIDTRTHRITLNSDPTLSRRQFLVFPDTKWWALDPGEQRIRLVADTFDSPAQVEILWRDAWL